MIVIVFTVIWLFLIYRLWSFWLYTHFNLFNWFIEYSWTNAWYIAVMFFIISIVFLTLIRKINNKSIKLLLAFIILLFWIIWKPLFYLISPDFKFYIWNTKYEYMDKQWNLTDIDKYLYYMWKYCDNKVDDFVFKRIYREDMCAWEYLYDFKIVEEYKKIFDYANENNMRELYRLTFIWAKDFWLEKIIEWYNDDTFYGYLMNYSFDLDILRKLSVNIKNNNLKNVIEYEVNKIIYFNENSNILNHDKWENYLNELNKELLEKLKQIPTINTNIF